MPVVGSLTSQRRFTGASFRAIGLGSLSPSGWRLVPNVAVLEIISRGASRREGPCFGYAQRGERTSRHAKHWTAKWPRFAASGLPKSGYRPGHWIRWLVFLVVLSCQWAASALGKPGPCGPFELDHEQKKPRDVGASGAWARSEQTIFRPSRSGACSYRRAVLETSGRATSMRSVSGT